MDFHVSLQPFISYCPSYPTIPYGIGRTVQWIPMCPPYSHSYTTVPFRIGRTVQWISMCPCNNSYPTVHPIPLSRLG